MLALSFLSFFSYLMERNRGSSQLEAPYCGRTNSDVSDAARRSVKPLCLLLDPETRCFLCAATFQTCPVHNTDVAFRPAAVHSADCAARTPTRFYDRPRGPLSEYRAHHSPLEVPPRSLAAPNTGLLTKTPLLMKVRKTKRALGLGVKCLCLGSVSSDSLQFHLLHAFGLVAPCLPPPPVPI